jgi:hypothetical protein
MSRTKVNQIVSYGKINRKAKNQKTKNEWHNVQ